MNKETTYVLSYLLRPVKVR